MGYRSDVTMAFYFADQFARDTFILKLHDPEFEPILQDVKVGEWRSLSDKTPELLLIVSRTSTKWGHMYPHVAPYYTLFEWITDDMSELIGVKMVRVGEDDTDIETEFFGNDNAYDLEMWVVRSIEEDIGGTPVPSPFETATQGE